MTSYLWITTNSPGELASWVSPLVARFIAEKPDLKIVIALVPCQYASGNEFEMASNIPGVYKVYRPKETIRMILTPRRRDTIHSGSALYLGGDPLYAKLIGLKNGWPVVAYTEHSYSLGMGIRTTLRKSVIGDLMASRIATYPKRSGPKEVDIVFFCGSRPAHFDHFAPFCRDVALQLLALEPTLKIALQRSVFIDNARWMSFASTVDARITLNEGSSLDILDRSRLLISLPGTSTAEGMYMGTPMAVLVPLNRPELIQLDGLLGLIGAIPGLGTWLKRAILYFATKRPRAVALPNLVSARRIVPEMVGVLEVESISTQILNLLNDSEQLAMQQNEFSKFPATTSASDAILAELKRWI